jgi:O-antigen/teichoic acid export membrane protein
LPFLWKKALAGVHALGPVSISLLYELALYGIPLILGEISVWIIDQSNRYLMELFYSTREVGMYSAAYLISWQPIILLHTLIRLSLGPRLINVWEKQGENASRHLLKTAARLYVLVAIPMVAGLSALAEPIMKTFTGPDFFNGYIIFPWIVCGAFFFGLQQSFNYVLLLLKRPRIVMYCLIISSLLNILLNFCFFPLFSYKIAAVNSLISYAFLYASLALTSRRYFRWPFPWSTVIRSLLAAGTMFGGIVFFINQATLSPLWTLCLAVPVGIIIYGLSLWILGEISPVELQSIQVGRRRWFDRQAAG